MTDEQIVKQISQQVGLAIGLSLMATTVQRIDPSKRGWIEQLRERSALLIAHVLRLVATHKEAITRWMTARKREKVMVEVR